MRTNLPRELLCVCLLAFAVGCVPDTQSIQVLQSTRMDSTCVAQAEGVQTSGGTLNIAEAEFYVGALVVRNEGAPEGISAGGQQVSSGARNDFNITEAVLSYELSENDGKNNPGAKTELAKEKTVPLAGRVQAGGRAGLGFFFLTPDRVAHLTSIKIGPEGLLLKTLIKLRGAFVNGSKHETPVFAYPILVFNPDSGTLKCDAAKQDKVIHPNSPIPACKNVGQDGSYPTCRDKPKSTGT